MKLLKSFNSMFFSEDAPVGDLILYWGVILAGVLLSVVFLVKIITF